MNAALPKDERIDALVEEIAQKQQQAAATAAKAIPLPDDKGLEVYGITIRPHTLAFEGLLARFSSCADVSNLDKTFAWLFMLAAPLETVYSAMRTAERCVEGRGDNDIENARIEGGARFMAAVHQWLDSTGLPRSATTELIERLNQTFELSRKLSEAAQDTNTTGALSKKN